MRNRDGYAAIARGEAQLELDGMAPEILSIIVERCGAFLVVRDRLHLVLIHPERDRDGLAAE